MRTFGQLIAGRLAIAFAVVVALLCVPVGSSAFHDAAAKGHVSTASLDDHGHSHDLDDVPVEKAAKVSGEHHKHNPGDHSHEKLRVPPEFEPVIARAGRTVAPPRADVARRGLSTTLDRPPRPSDIV